MVGIYDLAYNMPTIGQSTQVTKGLNDQKKKKNENKENKNRCGQWVEQWPKWYLNELATCIEPVGLIE